MAIGDITPLGSAVEFDTADYENAAFCNIDSTHFLLCWAGPGQDGYAQVFSIDGPGNITAIGTAFEYDTGRGTWPCVAQVDSSHYIVTYEGSGTDGFAVILEVNLSTFAVTAAGSALEFDTTNCQMPVVHQIDGTHYIVLWRGASNNANAQVLTVNTGTWAITTNGSPLTVNTESGTIGLETLNLLKLDSTHFLAVYSSVDTDGYAKTLSVDTSTWAVSIVGTPLEYETNSANNVSAVAYSSSKVVVYNYNQNTTTASIYLLNVDNSTWNVTSLDNDSLTDLRLLGRLIYLTNNIFVLANANSTDSNSQILTFQKDGNASGGLTELDEESVMSVAGATANIRVHPFTTSRILVAWQDNASGDGFVRAYDITTSSGTSSIKKIAGIDKASVKKVSNQDTSNIKKVSGVSNT